MRKPLPKKLHKLVGHREKFEDGTYICQGTYGSVRSRADTAAEQFERRYHYKAKVTEKKVRVNGENGIVRKPLFLVWVKPK
jgi:hypothetical protein